MFTVHFKKNNNLPAVNRNFIIGKSYDKFRGTYEEKLLEVSCRVSAWHVTSGRKPGVVIAKLSPSRYFWTSPFGVIAVELDDVGSRLVHGPG